MARSALLLLSALILWTSATGRGDVPRNTPEQLRKRATHIVVGVVRKVYSSVEEGRKWRDTDFVSEIAVERVEKGDRIEPGDAVYGRHWTRQWIGKPDQIEPFGSGHGKVSAGELVRVYLVRKEGGYDVVLPNGFEKLKKDPEPAS